MLFTHLLLFCTSVTAVVLARVWVCQGEKQKKQQIKVSISEVCLSEGERGTRFHCLTLRSKPLQANGCGMLLACCC